VVVRDNRAIATELQSLTQHVDHIKLIVASQQERARASDVVETFDVPASLDRHKVLHILIVLLANARDAVMTRQLGERRITVHARRGAEGNLEIAVEDNG